MDYATFLYATHGRPNSGPNCRTRTGLFCLEAIRKSGERETRTHVPVMIVCGNSNVKKCILVIVNQSCLEVKLELPLDLSWNFWWWYTKPRRAINVLYSTVQCTIRSPFTILELLLVTFRRS